MASRKFLNRHFINLVFLSLGFFGIFVAYSTVQNLESSITPSKKLGYYTLATIYACLCASSLFFSASASFILGPKISLIFGGLCYLALTAANIYPTWETLIPAAAILGTGGGILWAAQGAYLTTAATNYASDRNEEKTSALGFFTGFFFGIFQLTQVVGNVIASVILMFAGDHEKSTDHILFYTFLAIGAVGVLLFLFLGKETVKVDDELFSTINTSESDVDDIAYPEPNKKMSRLSIKDIWSKTVKQVKDEFEVQKDLRFILLLLPIVYSGMEQGFAYGDFTSEISDIKNTKWVGFIMAVFGLFDSLGSTLLGKLTDKIGKKLYLVVGFVSHMIVYVFFLAFLTFVSKDVFTDHFWIFFILAALLGLADACWCPFTSIMVSHFFNDKSEAAFALFKFWQALGSVFVFVWGPYLHFKIKLIILGVVLIATVISVIFLDVFVQPISGPVQKQPASEAYINVPSDDSDIQPKALY